MKGGTAIEEHDTTGMALLGHDRAHLRVHTAGKRT